MNPIEFFIPLKPKQKGNNKSAFMTSKGPRVVPNKKTKEHEETLKSMLWRYAPPKPWDGPVILNATFVCSAPNKPLWKRFACLNGTFYPCKRPDRGNLLKMIEDAAEGLFYVNDKQVIDGRVRKRYGKIDGYEIQFHFLKQAARV